MQKKSAHNSNKVIHMTIMERVKKLTATMLVFVLAMGLMTNGLFNPMNVFAEDITDPTGGSSIENGLLPDVNTPEIETAIDRETEKEEKSLEIPRMSLFSVPTLNLVVIHDTEGNLLDEIDAELNSQSSTYADVKTITVTGSAFMDFDDCRAIADNLTLCQEVDVSGVDFEDDAVPVYDSIGGFESFASLEKITLPSTVTKLEDYAFYGCLYLETINLDNITEIGRQVFYSCALVEVSMPELLKMGDYPFRGNQKLQTISMPELTSIPSEAFVYLTALTDVYLPKAQSVGDFAFWDCSSLETIDLPLATTVGSCAFMDCTALVNVNLPKAETIGDWAFGRNTLNNVFIGTGCASLTTISLPEATTIGTAAFYGCELLDTLSLPKVTTIGQVTFYRCSALGTIDLPKVETLGLWAFEACTALTSVSLPLATTINQGAFYGCKALTSVSLPLVTTVGQAAFYNCSALVTIDLPKAETLGPWAFEACTALATVSLPEVTTLERSVFLGCTSIGSIILPKATTIGDFAFVDCNNLETIELPKASTLGVNLFANDNSLKTLTFGSAAPSIVTDGGNGQSTFAWAPTDLTIMYPSGATGYDILKSNCPSTFTFVEIGQNKLVTGITVTGAGNATTIDTNGGTLQMSAAITPTDATNKAVTWSVVNDTGIAEISSDGLLAARSNGTVTVKATAKDSSATVGSLEITISNQVKLVTGITVTGASNATTVETGSTLQMLATVLPTDATNKAVTWSVENGTGTATIDVNGLLTPLTVGSVKVIATSTDGSIVKGERTIGIISGGTPAIDYKINSTEYSYTGSGGIISLTAGDTLEFLADYSPSSKINVDVMATDGSAVTIKGKTSSTYENIHITVADKNITLKLENLNLVAPTGDFQGTDAIYFSNTNENTATINVTGVCIIKGGEGGAASSGGLAINSESNLIVNGDGTLKVYGGNALYGSFAVRVNAMLKLDAKVEAYGGTGNGNAGGGGIYAYKNIEVNAPLKAIGGDNISSVYDGTGMSGGYALSANQGSVINAEVTATGGNGITGGTGFTSYGETIINAKVTATGGNATGSTGGVGLNVANADIKFIVNADIVATGGNTSYKSNSYTYNWGGSGILINTGVNTEIQSGTITATGGNGTGTSGGNGIDIYNAGTFKIKGGNITATGGNGTYGNRGIISNGKIEITGGTVTAIGGIGASTNGGGAIGAEKGIDIQGSTAKVTANGGDGAVNGGYGIWTLYNLIEITDAEVEASGGKGTTGNGGMGLSSDRQGIIVNSGTVAATGGFGANFGGSGIYSKESDIVIKETANVTSVGGDSNSTGGAGVRAFGDGYGKKVIIEQDAGNVYIRGGNGQAANGTNASIIAKEVYIATGNVGMITKETNASDVIIKNFENAGLEIGGEDVHMITVKTNPAAATTIQSNLTGTGGIYTYKAPAKADGVAYMWLLSGNRTVSASGYSNGVVDVDSSNSAEITLAHVTGIAVTGITVTGAGNSTTITAKGGTLQMSAAVLPLAATDSSVTWLVVNGSGSATVSQTGLLSATGNGTVTVKATANDGSNVSGTLVITISGQTSGGGGGSSSTKTTVQTLKIDANGTIVSSLPYSKETNQYISELTPKEGSAYLSIPSSILGDMAKVNPDSVIRIVTSYGIYEVSVNLNDTIPGLSDLLNKNNLKESDISIKITLTDKSGDEIVINAIDELLENGKILGNAVDFNIEIINNKTEKSISTISILDETVTKMIPMPKTMLNKNGEEVPFKLPEFYGAFKLNETTGKFTFVPHKARVIDGTTYVVIISKTNSVYMVAENKVSFTDVKEGQWYETFVAKAAAKKLVNGMGNDLYAPDKEVTRAEFVQMIVNALQITDISADAKTYSDVTKDAWYYSSIMQAKSAGILDKFTGADFNPNQSITREEMAIILAAAVKRENVTVTANIIDLSTVFNDYSEFDKANLTDIELIYRLNIMQGTGDGKFAPEGVTTRAQAATVQINLLKALDMID